MAEKDAEEIVIAYSTIDQEEKAMQFAQELVKRKWVACVNVVPGATSIYRWQGKIQQEKEFLLIMKTTTRQLSLVKSALKEIHPYEIPELIACKVCDGHAPYLDWVRAETK